MNLRSNSSLLGSCAAFTLSVLLLSSFSSYTHMAAAQIPGPTIAISINPSTNKIYVANPQTGFVSVISGATDIVTKSIKIPVAAPVSITLSVNPSTNKIYVATHHAAGGVGMISVIAGSTDTLTKPPFPIP